MQPDDRDAAYLWDMLEAARLIEEFTACVRFDQYARDRKLQLAIECALEIIGEGARCISDRFKDAHPQIPWRMIVAQRNVIAHEYGDIKQDRIWRVVAAHIPELKAQLQLVIPPPPAGGT